MTAAWQAAVEVPPRARAAWPFLPRLAPIGSVWVGEAGQTVRIALGGSVEAVAAPGHPRGGAASDPANAGRPRRYP